MTEKEAKKAIADWKCTNFPVDRIPEDKEDKPVKMVGNWISTGCNEEWYSEMFICSFCKGEMLGASNFCPDCGRRMRNENTAL